MNCKINVIAVEMYISNSKHLALIRVNLKKTLMHNAFNAFN